jgi:sodium-dependent dicarboxylate transporter 2/3/5
MILMLSKRRLGLIIGPLLFILAWADLLPLAGLSQEGRSVLAVALWMSAWWISEAIPISVTALLPIILLPV